MNFAVAVKAFLVRDSEILLLRRRASDPHKPGAWDIPGGRLDEGEDPFVGLLRELKEETGLGATVANPLTVHHFTRDDGQQITMLVFLCTDPVDNVVLSEEHTEYEWVRLDAVDERMGPYAKDVAVYTKFFAK